MAAISILQITDLHILRKPDETLLGVNTEHYFHAILEHAFANYQHFDLILVTGDLAQDPCPACYQRILNSLESYNTPCICLPGNHDDYILMQQILNTRLVNCRKQLSLENWQLICLNSKKPEDVPQGRLSRQELLFLEDCLSSKPDCHALIAVHHHCLKTNGFMDTMMIDNSQDFLAIINKYPQIKAITTGHIHQVMDITFGAVRVLGAPSTCFQFTPESEIFSVDTTAPGYRLIRLYADGRLESDIIHLPGQLSKLQLDPGGY
ncbi:MAG: 3',5'-cyclic-AMP phosphodiesterase [Gammaproteobacteria bacterium]